MAKGRYIYYRCSFGKGRHKVPWLPEARLADMLGEAVRQICIPEQVRTDVIEALVADQERIKAKREGEANFANERLSEIEGFKRRVYRDRLRGLIDESLWCSMAEEWNAEQLRLRTTL